MRASVELWRSQAELPGMVDLKVMQRGGVVVWPPELCSVPVCAIKKARGLPHHHANARAPESIPLLAGGQLALARLARPVGLVL
jgi:hypothetical protein